ncbi:hypothetical protein BDQ12DRAFT_725973 [Crucibulum laeve]|uniref:Uncharacterized protein n=1 Tax=Crucibulum laeve TaxID=68775 RepID=A0A5C3LRP7_9AGAR|nr:hypothetical protein BDQ12DRAFT_725973 [Crucibulum laeve]
MPQNTTLNQIQPPLHYPVPSMPVDTICVSFHFMSQDYQQCDVSDSTGTKHTEIRSTFKDNGEYITEFIRPAQTPGYAQILYPSHANPTGWVEVNGGRTVARQLCKAWLRRNRATAADTFRYMRVGSSTREYSWYELGHRWNGFRLLSWSAEFSSKEIAWTNPISDGFQLYLRKDCEEILLPCIVAAFMLWRFPDRRHIYPLLLDDI